MSRTFGQQVHMQKVITYIDGFNLYFGLCAAGLRKYLWLNVQQLALNLLKPGQLLVCTKYFTSRVSDTPSDTQKSKRQGVSIEALQKGRLDSRTVGQ